MRGISRIWILNRRELRSGTHWALRPALGWWRCTAYELPSPADTPRYLLLPLHLWGPVCFSCTRHTSAHHIARTMVVSVFHSRGRRDSGRDSTQKFWQPSKTTSQDPQAPAPLKANHARPGPAVVRMPAPDSPHYKAPEIRPRQNPTPIHVKLPRHCAWCHLSCLAASMFFF